MPCYVLGLDILKEKILRSVVRLMAIIDINAFSNDAISDFRGCQYVKDHGQQHRAIF